MTFEQIARAVWILNSPQTMILKARAMDGGTVLAIIRGGWSEDYRWETTGAPIVIGTHFSRYGAQLAARKAVRETMVDM